MLEQQPGCVYRGLAPDNSYQLHDALSGPQAYQTASLDLRVYRELLRKEAIPRPEHTAPRWPPDPHTPALRFDSCFESGNLAFAFRSSSTDFALFLRIDTNTKGHTQWFHFTATADQDLEVRFSIMNMSKAKSIFAKGGLPVWAAEPGQWQPVQAAEYEALTPAERAQWLPAEGYREVNALRFRHQLVAGQTTAFAYSVPYTYGDLQRALADPHPLCTASTLCLSESGLQVPMLVFRGACAADAPVAFVSARVHPGESCSSHMCAGLLDWLRLASPEARDLLAAVELRVVPMVNVDGVVAGNFRTGLAGDDLNRKYLKPSASLHPAVAAIKRCVAGALRQEKRRVVAFLDLHGHSTKPNVFTYGPDLATGDRAYPVARYFAQLLAERLDCFRLADCSWEVPASKKRTARSVMLSELGVKLAFTVEASTAARSGPDGSLAHMTARDYAAVGAALAQALGEVAPFLADPAANTRPLLARLSLSLAGRGTEEGGSDSESEGEDFKGAEKRQLRRNIESAILAESSQTRQESYFVKAKSKKRAKKAADKGVSLGLKVMKARTQDERNSSQSRAADPPSQQVAMNKRLFSQGTASIFGARHTIFRQKERRQPVVLSVKSIETPASAAGRPGRPLAAMSKHDLASVAVTKKRQSHSLESSLVQASSPQKHRSLRLRQLAPPPQDQGPHCFQAAVQRSTLESVKSSGSSPTQGLRTRAARSVAHRKPAKPGGLEPTHDYYAGWMKECQQHDVLFSQIAIKFPRADSEEARQSQPQVSKKALLGEDFSRLVGESSRARPASNLPALHSYLQLRFKQTRVSRLKE